MYCIETGEQRLYWKRVSTRWIQPLLTSNDGSTTLKVWGTHNRNSGQSWRSFATEKGYTSGYYTGNYGNEYSTTMYLYMKTDIPILVTGFSLYSPTINSNSDWGSISSTRFYGSNDGETWVLLKETGHFDQDQQVTFTFDNSTYYNYYQYQMTTYGSGHRDQSNVSSFRLIGTYETLSPGTADDYDFYEDVPRLKGISKEVRKYYKYYPVMDIQVVGTPTIENFIIKTFSTSNYTQVNNVCNRSDDVDYIVKFKTSDIQTLCTALNSSYFVTVEVNAGNISVYNHESQTRLAVCPITANTWYWVKVNVNGGVRTVYYSLDGEIWTLGISISSDSRFAPSATPLRFGVGVDSAEKNYGTDENWIRDQIFTGEIDLSGCSVRKGDTIIWQGVRQVPRESTPSDYDFYEDVNIYKGIGQRVRRYYKYSNIPNVNVVGKPCIINGVVNEFASSTYITPVNALPTLLPWEIVVKCHYISNSSVTQLLISPDSSAAYGNVLLGIKIDNKAYLYLGSNNSQWNIVNGDVGDYSFVDGTDYWIKLEFTGAQYNLYVSTDGTTYSNILSVNSSTLVYDNQGLCFGLEEYNKTSNTFWRGSIDLKESYIKRNGEYWWHGMRLLNYVEGTHVNGKVLGNPTINGSVVSGFSPSNYIQANTSFVPGDNVWEMFFDVTTGSDVTTEQYIVSQSPNVFSEEILIKETHFMIGISFTNGTRVTPSPEGTHVVQPNTHYFLKFYFTGSSYKLDYSLDGQNFVNDITYSSSSLVQGCVDYIIGVDQAEVSYAAPFLGSINFENCSMKINNQTVWTGMITETGTYDYYEEYIT